MYDITLINVSTPVPRGNDREFETYLPLGCLYLTSALERAGFAVDFRDYQLLAADLPDPCSVESFQAFCAGTAPILGVSCMISMLPLVILGTKAFRHDNPDVTVVLGGAGPSGAALEIVSAFPWIDAVCIGEGEETAVDLVRTVSKEGSLKTVKGIAYRDDDGVHVNAPRPRIQDPDTIPFPAYEKGDVSRYSAVSIITGRGCPFKCTFCDVGPLWGNRTTLRSVENVTKELNLLQEQYKVKTVHFADDTFDLKRTRVEAICEAMSGLEMGWTCLARVDLMDAPLLARMSDAGCQAVFLGLESGSNAVLRRINKRFTIEEATRSVELATKYIQKIVASYIWGYPFETLDDFKLTLLSVLAMWHLDAVVGLKLLSPMPLSPLGIEYRDRLAFSEELCSVFASLGNIVPGQTTKRAELPEQFVKLVRNHRRVFAGFYHIKSDTIDQKSDILRRFSRKMGVLA